MTRRLTVTLTVALLGVGLTMTGCTPDTDPAPTPAVSTPAGPAAGVAAPARTYTMPDTRLIVPIPDGWEFHAGDQVPPLREQDVTAEETAQLTRFDIPASEYVTRMNENLRAVAHTPGRDWREGPDTITVALSPAGEKRADRMEPLLRHIIETGDRNARDVSTRQGPIPGGTVFQVTYETTRERDGDVCVAWLIVQETGSTGDDTEVMVTTKDCAVRDQITGLVAAHASIPVHA